jgi:hypothetical protein
MHVHTFPSIKICTLHSIGFIEAYSVVDPYGVPIEKPKQIRSIPQSVCYADRPYICASELMALAQQHQCVIKFQKQRDQSSDMDIKLSSNARSMLIWKEETSDR